MRRSPAAKQLFSSPSMILESSAERSAFDLPVICESPLSAAEFRALSSRYYDRPGVDCATPFQTANSLATCRTSGLPEVIHSPDLPAMAGRVFAATRESFLKIPNGHSRKLTISLVNAVFHELWGGCDEKYYAGQTIIFVKPHSLRRMGHMAEFWRSISRLA